MKQIEYEVDVNGCWNCISHSCGSDYPQVYRDGKLWKVTRYLWKERYGGISDDLDLLHNCDNKRCINLEHVRLGTDVDNVADYIARCGKYGKLTEDQVRFIRTNRFPEGQGLNGAELARMFNVNCKTIRKIVNVVSWKWIR